MSAEPRTQLDEPTCTLLYFHIEGAAPPESHVFHEPDISVDTLRKAVADMVGLRGREFDVVIDDRVIESPSTLLSSLGVRHADLIRLVPKGEPRPPKHDSTQAEAASAANGAISAHDLGGRQEPPRDEYEEMTEKLQWSAPFHVDGRVRERYRVWATESTQLRSSDWDAFRAPDRLYYRSYVRQQAESDSAVTAGFDFARRRGSLLTQLDPGWTDQLREVLPALQFPEWGLCVIHQHVTRFALSSFIAGATEFQMFDEMRHAQLFARLTLTFDEHFGDFDRGKELWLHAEHFQPLRRVVEQLLATLDWGEEIIAADVLLDPLLARAVDQILLGQAPAIPRPDLLTQVVWGAIEQDEERHRSSGLAFLNMVADDPRFGETNRAQVQAWLDRWAPEIIEAVQRLSVGLGGPPLQLDTLISDLGRWSLTLPIASAPQR